MMDLGYSAELITEYVDLTDKFTSALGENLLPGMQGLFGVCTGLWLTLGGLRIALGTLEPAQLLKEFIFVVIAFVLLFAPGLNLVHDIYRASLDIMGSAASLAINAGNILGVDIHKPEGMNGLVALVNAAQSGFVAVWMQGWIIAGDAAWDNWSPIFYGLLLFAPFLLLALGYVVIIVVSMFRLTLIAAISPFLMLALGFDWGRGMVLQGFRTMIGSILVLYAASAAVGMVLFGVSALEVGKTNSINIAEDVFSQSSYLVALCLGWTGAALLREGIDIANSIAQSSLTDTSAAAMVAGVATAPLVAYEFATGKSVRAAAYKGRIQGYLEHGSAEPDRGIADGIKKYREHGVDRSP